MWNKPRARAAVIGVIVGVALLFWWRYRADARQLAQVRELQKELFSSQQQGSPEQRREKWQSFREATKNLTPQQRQALRAEGQARRDQRMLKYAAASKAERQRILDEDIRRMQDRWQRQQNRGDQAGGGRGRPDAFGAAGASGNQANGRNGPRSNEERLAGMKKGLDSSTPEARSARDIYFKDLQARREQLGLPSPNRGGFGGGRGGGRW